MGEILLSIFFIVLMIIGVVIAFSLSVAAWYVLVRATSKAWAAGIKAAESNQL